MENKSTGYVAIFRSVMDHWIWRDDKKFKWWIWLLLNANYKNNKVNFGYEIFDCNRGQLITSIQSLCEKWLATPSTVRGFLNLLEKDSMIAKKSCSKFTQITICNYESYQITQQTDDKRITNGQQTDDKPITTNNKNNKENKDNKNKELKESVLKIYSFYPSKCIIQGRSLGKCEKNKRQIESLLKIHSDEDILKIITLYIQDCKNTNTYMKSFSTFLNNFPIDFLETVKPEPERKILSHKEQWG